MDKIKDMNKLSFPLIHFQEIDSTNNYLSALCEEQEVADFTVVLAQFQSDGRGQRGNAWESAPQKNLTFSYLLHPDFIDASHQFLLSEMASLAVKDTLNLYTDDITIKWPNDIYWREKKIGGMLIENRLTGMRIDRSIHGIGININQEEFRSTAPNPVSLKQITGKEYVLMHLLEQFMERLRDSYERLRSGETAPIDRRYRNSLFRKNGLHAYQDASGIFKARIADVESDGRLVLVDERGNERKYMFKEVAYR